MTPTGNLSLGARRGSLIAMLEVPVLRFTTKINPCAESDIKILFLLSVITPFGASMSGIGAARLTFAVTDFLGKDTLQRLLEPGTGAGRLDPETLDTATMKESGEISVMPSTLVLPSGRWMSWGLGFVEEDRMR